MKPNTGTGQICRRRTCRLQNPARLRGFPKRACPAPIPNSRPFGWPRQRLTGLRLPPRALRRCRDARALPLERTLLPPRGCCRSSGQVQCLGLPGGPFRRWACGVCRPQRLLQPRCSCPCEEESERAQKGLRPRVPNPSSRCLQAGQSCPHCLPGVRGKEPAENQHTLRRRLIPWRFLHKSHGQGHGAPAESTGRQCEVPHPRGGGHPPRHPLRTP